MHKSLLEGYKINGAVWLLVARARGGDVRERNFTFHSILLRIKGDFILTM